MRYTWIFLFLTLIFGYISNYLIISQSPWDKQKLSQDLELEEIVTNDSAVNYIEETIDLGLVWDYIDLQSLAIVSAFVFLTGVFGFSTVHTFIDKLFFKKFFEMANWKNALRRGILLFLLIYVLIIFRLIGTLIWYVVLPLVVLFIAVEYSITMQAIIASKDERQRSQEEDEEG